MPGLFFFDDRLPSLAPLTDLRPVWDLRTGALTTRQRLEAQLRMKGNGCFIREELFALAGFEDPKVLPESQVTDGLYVNARVVTLPQQATQLAPGQVLKDPATNTVVAANLDAAAALTLLRTGDTSGTPVAASEPAKLLTRPWHIRTYRDDCLLWDLDFLGQCIPAATAPTGGIVFGLAPLRIAPSAKIYPGVVIDLEHGAVVIDAHATIRPGAQLIGPCYVGQHSTILERATIRGGSAIGPWCKINGETGGTIYQGYSNKAHDGYVGDSYLGEWVNLGAGTTTSNLLNTYGEIITKASPDSSNERTGFQFLGSIIGDHTKTAICTRLMTGTIIHTGAMIATTAAASGCVPPFAWCTDAGTRSFRLDKFTQIMTLAMGRRKVTPSPAYIARIAAMHAMDAKRHAD